MTRRAAFAALLLVAAATPAAAQRLGQGPADDISLWRVGAALLLCLVLAVAGAYVLKAGGGRWPVNFLTRPKARRLQVLESLRIGRQVDLCIVGCDGQELLVAVHAQGATLLDRLPPQAAGAQDGAGP